MKRLIAAYKNLSEPARSRLLSFIMNSSPIKEFSEGKQIAIDLTDTPRYCPHCRCPSFSWKKCGKTAQGRQRYKCPNCGHTRSYNKKDILHNSRLSGEKLLPLITCTLQGLTAQATALQIGTSNHTVTRYRRKLKPLLNSLLERWRYTEWLNNEDREDPWIWDIEE